MKKWAAVVVGLVFAAPAFGQLYGDGKDVTQGELNDQDYWWARFDLMMLDVAQKQHQPEGRIGFTLVSATKRLEDLAKKYPKHKEILAMKQRADEALKSVNPNAERQAPFSPSCPWEQPNFAQLWVNMHWGQAAWAEKDYASAQGSMSNVNRNLDVLLEPDRLKSFPPELAKYVRDTKGEAAKLTKLVSEKLTMSTGPGIKAEPGVTKGDLDNQDYWWARYDDMMLDVALKARQPEGSIDLELVGTLKRLADLTAQFPNHEGIKQMKEHAEGVKAKIDPKANRGGGFSPDVPWEEANFAQLWVNLHWAHAAHEHKNDAAAAGMLGSIAQNQQLLLAANRMKDYPPELKKWVEDSKPDLERLGKEVKAGRGKR
jgi:hypothetical protein